MGLLEASTVILQEETRQQQGISVRSSGAGEDYREEHRGGGSTRIDDTDFLHIVITS